MSALHSPTTVGIDDRFAPWARSLGRSALQEMLVFAQQPDVISFALGLPDPTLFPQKEFAAAAIDVLATDPYALQYGPPSQRLRSLIVGLMAQRGVSCSEEQIFLTSGAQQGMNLLARLLLDHGGMVMTEEIVYTGFQQVLQPFEPQILSVPTDATCGIDLKAVTDILESGVRPAFLYVITEGHNPLTLSLQLEQRMRLAELATAYRLPIIEDDAYGFLSYSDVNNPPIRAFNDQWVYYLGSFSKILAPGLRAGWIVAPPEVLPKLSSVKEASDIDTATFSQRLVASYMASGQLGNHIKTLQQVYKERRNCMISVLNRHLPGVHCQVPTHGMFLWVELPSAVDMMALLAVAIADYRVAFIPGQVFALQPNATAKRSMRLNFSHSSVDQIEEGIRRLGQALTAEGGYIYDTDKPSGL